MAPPEPPRADRRRFPRVKAPVLVRPARRVTQLAPRPVGDIGEGGFRAYTDEERAPGERLEVELLLPDGSAVALVEVVWTEPLPAEAGARFDVGLRFVEVRREDLARILALLGEP